MWTQGAAPPARRPSDAKLDPASCAKLAGGGAVARRAALLLLWEQLRYDYLGPPPANQNLPRTVGISTHVVTVTYVQRLQGQIQASSTVRHSAKDGEIKIVYSYCTLYNNRYYTCNYAKSEQYTTLQNGYIRY